MKLAYFDDFKLGVVKGDGVVDVSDVVQDIPHTGPGDLMSGLIARFDDYRGKLEAAAEAGKVVPLSSVRIRPPLPKPGNIDCMAVNYMEDGTLAQKPLRNAFHKASSAIIGHGDTMILPDVPATIFEGEAELAMVIGKRADNVSEADAMSHVFGYLNFIDGSARGLPPDRNVFFQVKSRATFAPIGPFLVTADEIDDPYDLDMSARLNGEELSRGNSGDIYHSFERMIEHVSRDETIWPGEVFGAGTIGGGSGHEHFRLMEPGDTIELEIEKIGVLRNRVVAQD